TARAGPTSEASASTDRFATTLHYPPVRLGGPVDSGPSSGRTRMRAWALLGGSCAVQLVACGGGSTADMGTPDAAVDTGAACTTNAQCDDGTFCNGAERCSPGSPGADSHGCVAATAPCLASQTCDEAMNACVSDCGAAPDADGDGHASTGCGGDDCDDANAHRYPGNPESCNDVDEDCDPATI